MPSILKTLRYKYLGPTVAVILKLYNLGYKAPKISVKMNVLRSTVYYIVKEKEYYKNTINRR